MAQHDYILDNNPGATFRGDLNAVLDAIKTLNSGATEPGAIYPGMFWLDTSAATLLSYPDGRLWQRNQSNSAWVGPGGLIGSNIKVSVLTTSQTWTRPPGLKFLDAIVVGGGGGVAAAALTAAAQGSGTSGGGGGGTSRKMYAATAITPTVAVTIGAGGAIGVAGGASIFLGQTGNGGAAGGVLAAGAQGAANGGAGGAATGGDTNTPGSNGGIAWRLLGAYSIGGDGGQSLMCNRVSAVLSATTNPAAAGMFPGGGARGPSNAASQAAAAGAVGGAGAVILTEYY